MESLLAQMEYTVNSAEPADAKDVVRHFRLGQSLAALQHSAVGTKPGAELNVDYKRIADVVEQIRREVAKVLVGQEEIVEGVLIALVAQGHVLIEGVPGLGKTLLVRALARVLSLQFKRIQFTPDLMPSDVTGNKIYDAKQNELVFRPGPVFTQLLLADEINRAPAKTQSALLEAMQERQVTIDGQAYTPAPALHHHGHAEPGGVPGHLPAARGPARSLHVQAQHDLPGQGRGEPHPGQLRRGLRRGATGRGRACGRSATRPAILELQGLASAVRGGRAGDRLHHLHRGPDAQLGQPVPRGQPPGQRDPAAHQPHQPRRMAGRDLRQPRRRRRLAPWTLRHRIILNPDAEIEGLTADRGGGRRSWPRCEVPELR